MIGCLRARARKQTIIALYFEFETVLNFNNLGPGYQLKDSLLEVQHLKRS